MRRLLLILISSIALGCYAHAQTMGPESPKVKIDRRIYVWDVTKSMQGHNRKTQQYDPSLDVWDKFVKWLKDDIEAITDSSTELVVLPFQETVLERWTCKATVEGKAELLRKIDDAKKQFQDLTYTNICGPFEIAKRDYVSSDKNNLVILLTDGQQSEKEGFGGQNAWLAMLNNWGNYARKNNAYLVYFMVTPEAVDTRIIDTLIIDDNKPYCTIVTPTETPPTFIDIYPQSEMRINIKDDLGKEVIIPLDKSKKSIDLAEGIKVSVKSQTDAPIKIDEVIEVKNDVLSIKPEYNYDELKKFMGANESMRIALTLELVNQDEILQKANQKIILQSSKSKLELINKIEKVLKISWKKR